MTSLRPFQIILIVIFVFLALLSILLLSTYNPPPDPDEVAYGDGVVIWGTLPYRAVSGVLSEISKVDRSFSAVTYVDIRPETFANDFVNAIAEGRSPDLLLMPHTDLVKHRSKLLPIPYTTVGFTERDIRDRFIDGAEIFARNDGFYAVPVAVDPMVLYWNRDLLATAGLASAPTTWEQLIAQAVPLLTKRDNNRNILQSAVAFGEYRNVRHAYGVLSLLLLQSGSQMVQEGTKGYVVALNQSENAAGRPPLESAVQFYTDFANTTSPLYSWNRAEQEDQLAFIASDLALYFGYGSEAATIESRNPNLNFDVAMVPQGADATVFRTYGTFYGFAIPRASGNTEGAFNAARVLSSGQNALALSKALQMAPVERRSLGAGGSGALESIVYQAALVARGWLSPDLPTTESALQTMVEDVVSGRERPSNAVNDAIDRLILAY